MIRLKHILAEIGEASLTPYPYHMYNGEAYFETAAGTMYRVNFDHGSDDVMEIAFSTQNPQGGWEHDVETAESDVYRIMSTVVAIVRKAVDKQRPSQILFGVAKSDPRRMQLYRAFVLKALHGYSISQETASFMQLQRDGSLASRFDWTGTRGKR